MMQYFNANGVHYWSITLCFCSLAFGNGCERAWERVYQNSVCGVYLHGAQARPNTTITTITTSSPTLSVVSVWDYLKIYCSKHERNHLLNIRIYVLNVEENPLNNLLRYYKLYAVAIIKVICRNEWRPKVLIVDHNSRIVRFVSFHLRASTNFKNEMQAHWERRKIAFVCKCGLFHLKTSFIFNFKAFHFGSKSKKKTLACPKNKIVPPQLIIIIPTTWIYS